MRTWKEEHNEEPMHKLLTVVIQTSPIPSHPSTALLEALFRGFQNYADGVLESRVIILADGYEKIDGIEAENNKHGKISSESALRYQKHLEVLQAKVQNEEFPFCPKRSGSIELLLLPYRHGSARGVRAAFFELETKCQAPSIATRFVMVGQHDNFFVREAPVRQVVQAMQREPGLGIEARCIHFLSTSTLNYLDKIERRYGLKLQLVRASANLPFPLVPLVFWYGRTHISTAEYFREYIFQKKCQTLQSKDHLEELLGPAQLADILERGPTAQAEYGTYVLQTSETEDVIYHLSGRRARAVSEMSADQDKLDNNVEESNGGPQAPAIHGSSFTTARTCKAIVPGLTILGQDQPRHKTNFKQRCFHCGQKGHSFKFCPDIRGGQGIAAETIDLS